MQVRQFQSISKIFLCKILKYIRNSQIYELVTGTKSAGFTVLEFTYSIGIAIGILTFFNHFGKRRFSVDPTPIEVEMRLYENDLQTTLIENSSRKEQELDVGTKYPTGSHRS